MKAFRRFQSFNPPFWMRSYSPPHKRHAVGVMPVLLSTQEHFDTWMQGAPVEAFALTRGCLHELIQIVQTGYDKKI